MSIYRPARIGLAFLATLMGSMAQAVEIDTGHPDFNVRFDNTIRYNLAQRIENRDSRIGNSAISDEGDYRFNKGDWVSNRLDLLSEFDVVYKNKTGFRVSTAAWYDNAYGNTGKSNPNPPLNGIPSYVGNRYSDLVKRLYAGPSGELLDAFVFANLDDLPIPTRFKLGRHTVYYGESLLLGGNVHSVAYAQNPLDLQKGFASPGAEAKELFRPLHQLSFQSQVTDTLSIAGQYVLQWEAARYPEGGTYLGPVDFAFNGPDRQFVSASAGFAYRGDPITPRQRGEFGGAARWSPEWLEGTLGLYYRNFADKLPQAFITSLGPANTSQYNLIYPDHIDLYGISLSKNMAGISLGAEVSYRHNTPLLGQTLGIAPVAPAQGDTRGPRGNTWHALINGVGVLPKIYAYDTATWLAELTYARWSRVISGESLFNALGYTPCNGKDTFDGCVTKDYFGIGVGVTPTWFQVFPGVDVSAPLTYSVGVKGNAPTTFGGNQGLGNYSLGVAVDIQQKYRVDLKYIDYVGRYKDNGSAVTSVNGFTTYLKDRGFINLTFKTTL